MGQASQEMIKELQKMQQDQVKDTSSKQGSHDSGAKFNQVLNNSQVNEVQNLNKVQDTQKAAQTIQAAQSGKVNAAMEAQKSQRVTGAEKADNGMFKGVVKELMAGQTKMEGLMKVAMSGKQLSNQEMLGIQAGVYMFSQQMELTSKVIEKATSGIKQMLNTQV